MTGTQKRDRNQTGSLLIVLAVNLHHVDNRLFGSIHVFPCFSVLSKRDVKNWGDQIKSD